MEKENKKPVLPLSHHLPHKKRVQCSTEAGMERAQALGAWGEKNPKRTSSHSLFSPTNKIRSINLPLQHTYMHQVRLIFLYFFSQ
jgi:hypothetical protein